VADEEVHPATPEEEVRRHLEELVLGPPLYTGEEVAERAAMTIEDAERLWVELGFPPVARDVRHFSDADAQVLRHVTEFRQWDVVAFEDILSMTRVLGQTLSRAAGAQARLTLARAEALRAEGADVPTDQAGVLDVAVELGLQVSEQFLSYVWRRHLVDALGRLLDPRPTEVVGFADLVGYSRLSSKLDATELPALIGRFQHVCNTAVTAAGGQVVKLIGDAVMFVAPEPVEAALAALAIRDELAVEPDAPAVRIGLAIGPLVHLEGDVYGDTVNRASRLAELARPDTVLADDELATALAGRDEVGLRALRPHRLKGIGLVRAWSVRPGRGSGH
jgi:adenylate cyclase